MLWMYIGDRAAAEDRPRGLRAGAPCVASDRRPEPRRRLSPISGLQPGPVTMAQIAGRCPARECRAADSVCRDVGAARRRPVAGGRGAVAAADAAAGVPAAPVLRRQLRRRHRCHARHLGELGQDARPPRAHHGRGPICGTRASCCFIGGRTSPRSGPTISEASSSTYSGPSRSRCAGLSEEGPHGPGGKMAMALLFPDSRPRVGPEDAQRHSVLGRCRGHHGPSGIGTGSGLVSIRYPWS